MSIYDLRIGALHTFDEALLGIRTVAEGHRRFLTPVGEGSKVTLSATNGQGDKLLRSLPVYNPNADRSDMWQHKLVKEDNGTYTAYSLRLLEDLLQSEAYKRFAGILTPQHPVIREALGDSYSGPRKIAHDEAILASRADIEIAPIVTAVRDKFIPYEPGSTQKRPRSLFQKLIMAAPKYDAKPEQLEIVEQHYSLDPETLSARIPQTRLYGKATIPKGFGLLGGKGVAVHLVEPEKTSVMTTNLSIYPAPGRQLEKPLSPFEGLIVNQEGNIIDPESLQNTGQTLLHTGEIVPNEQANGQGVRLDRSPAFYRNI